MVTGRLRLRLFSHDEIVLMPGEVVQVLRHRLMMTFYLIGVLALIWLNWDTRVPGLSLEVHAPPQVLAVLAGGLVPALGLIWADRRARRGADVVISASRLFLCAAVLGFAGYTVLAVPLGVTPMPSIQEAVLDIAFNYVLAEIIGGLAVHFIAPPLLTELRRFATSSVAPLPSAVQTNAMLERLAADPTLGQPVTPGSAVTPESAPAPNQAQVRVANRLFDAGDILLVQAERTHVILTTARGKQILPGPFSAVVVQIPPELGQQVSRADWVATSAVDAIRREGRDMMLLCRDGQELRIAASRQTKLRDWFDQFSEAPHQAAS
ncbi:MAG: hypothetical protein CFE34_07480 [Rhodobacteraceae bacterium PARR1]|nr:MAG: hypothetical protein CFE34_07480 [Rhodobacteraceae bacterium PARR1]